MILLLKNVLFTLLVPATFAVYLPLLLAEDRTPASLWAVLLAVPLFIASAAIYAWCVWDFATFGRATPAPIDAPKRLVVRGLYRYVRNPIYVAVLLSVVAWVILFQRRELLIYLVAASIGFHLFVVLYEERGLKRRFGKEYDAYRAQVGRWLPKWRREPAP